MPIASTMSNFQAFCPHLRAKDVAFGVGDDLPPAARRRIICHMERSEGHPPPVTSIEFPEGRPGRPQPRQKESTAPSLDQAMRSTETALGQLTKAAIEEIRREADVSPHVEAAERDLRNALKQLGLAKRAASDRVRA